MRNVSRFLLSGLLLAQLFFAFPAVAADWLYTVRPEDKLWGLAEKFCGTHARWRDIAEYNQIANPTNLKPGSRIRIPLKWLIEEPAVVRVVYARGDVRIKHRSLVSTATAAATTDGNSTATAENADELADSVVPPFTEIVGAELGIGSQVITGPQSYANVAFADGSTMQIGPDSEVQFDTLSAYRDTGMVDSRVRINRGSGASEVKPQEGPGSVYRIATPLGVAAVRGTEFRTRTVDGANFVETTGGAVDFMVASSTSNVASGFGLKADASGVAVEKLLEPPQLSAEQTYNVNDSFVWKSLVGAATYLVHIYNGPDLAEVSAQLSAPDAEIALASLGPGSYVLGVRGIATSGVQGLEAIQAITVQNILAAPANVTVKQIRRSPELKVSWDGVSGATDYRVVATPLGGGTPHVQTTAATQQQLTDLAPGIYRVSVQASSPDLAGEVSAVEEQRVRAPFNWGLGTVLAAIAVVL